MLLFFLRARLVISDVIELPIASSSIKISTCLIQIAQQYTLKIRRTVAEMCGARARPARHYSLSRMIEKKILSLASQLCSREIETPKSVINLSMSWSPDFFNNTRIDLIFIAAPTQSCIPAYSGDILAGHMIENFPHFPPGQTGIVPFLTKVNCHFVIH